MLVVKGEACWRWLVLCGAAGVRCGKLVLPLVIVVGIVVFA